MGCFPSRERCIEVHDEQEQLSDESFFYGRVGIAPVSFSSSSSSSSSRRSTGGSDANISRKYELLEKAAAGIQEILVSDDEATSRKLRSDLDESSIESYSVENALYSLSSCNHSIIDGTGGGDESVVDWLAESSGTNANLLGGSVFSASEHTSEPVPYQHNIIPNGSHLFVPTSNAHGVPDSRDDDQHFVKDTTHVDRYHAPLPVNKPSAKHGDWLTNRYCINDYIVLNEIGCGAHSEVRLCKNKKSNALFAVKIMNRKLLQSKSADFQKEVQIMKRLKHQNILRLYEYIDDPKVNKVYLITEFAQRGDLMSIIQKNEGSQSDSQLRNIVRQVISGLLHLHENNICHNDLKPSNLLVDGNGNVLIADFGVSRSGRVRLDSAGTPAFMPPEVVAGEPHDGQLADCYSLGATIFCIKFGRPPFLGRGANKNQKLLDLYSQIKSSPLVFPSEIDNDLSDLIQSLMRKESFRRLRLAEAQKHPWLK